MEEPLPAAPLGVVLAGGRSTRLGRPKPAAPLGDRSLIEYPLAALRGAGLETVVVAKSDTELPPLDVPVWLEPETPSHPLAGIVCALARSDGRALIVCACDLPFVTGPLAARLAELADPLVVPSAGGLLHPLLARYDPSLAGALTAALSEEAPLQETILALGPRIFGEDELAAFGDPAELLFNVNTPADLARAQSRIPR